MTRLTSIVVCIGLLCLGAAPRASAEPIRITGGSFTVQEHFPKGSLAIAGTRGFSLSSPSVATIEGRIDAENNCRPCDPGVSTISIGAFQGGTSFFGPATLDGLTYQVGEGINDPEFIALEFFGISPVPGVDSLPTSVTVPFTVKGIFMLPLSETAIEGRGLATISFRLDAAGYPRNPFFERIRYDFTDAAPVPEPATLTMFAGGLLAMVRATRKRRVHPRA